MKPKHSGVCRCPSSAVYLSSALDEWIFQAFSFWLQQSRLKRSISWLKPVTPLIVLWIRGSESRRAFVSVFSELAVNLGSRICAFNFTCGAQLGGTRGQILFVTRVFIRQTPVPHLLTRGGQFSFRPTFSPRLPLNFLRRRVNQTVYPSVFFSKGPDIRGRRCGWYDLNVTAACMCLPCARGILPPW